MSYLSAILLGLIQGISEFLPISSSGHLAIFQNFFGLQTAEGENLFFDVLLHLGTLVAVFAAYWPEIKELILSFFALFLGRSTAKLPQAERQKFRWNQRFLLLIILATLPLVLVLPIKDAIDRLYYNTIIVGFALLVTGAILFVSDRMRRGSKTERNATIADALLVGLGQAFATVPGISRSGTTISIGMLRGFDRPFAVRFSFIMSIPAVLGANILSMVDAVKAGIDWSLMPMYLVGVVAAALSGYLAIRFLKYITNRGGFGGFAFYCWGAGIVTIVLSLIA